MGLAHRIIPVVLARGRELVKGIAFDAWRSVGLAAQAVRIHQARGVDELVLLDITATSEARHPNLELVAELTETCFMPLAVGGGVRSLDDVRALLRVGADKVVIGTAALENPELVTEVAQAIGSQALVVAIDYYEHPHRVATRCGKHRLGWRPEAAAEAMANAGAGEILLTAIAREGRMEGYDIETILQVAAAVEIPVIAHGGAGCYEDMLQAVQAGASAIAAGAMFQFTDATPRGAAEYLAKRSIEVRL